MLNLRNGGFLLGLLAGIALTALLGIFVFTLVQAARPAQPAIPQPAASATPTEPVAVTPTDTPVDAPTDAPVDAPTDAPTEAPTDAPTEAPTDAPVEPRGVTGYEIVRGPTVSGEGGTFRSTATCPAGKTALGGGGSQGDLGWYVDDTAPTDGGNGWYVEYSPSIAGEPGAGIGEAWAVCALFSDSSATAPGAAGYEIVRGPTVSGEGETYRSTAACPDGKKALGGGGSQGDFGWYVDDSAPTDNGAGWYVEYSPAIAGEPGSGIGEAWALCAFVDDGSAAAQSVAGYEIVRGPTVNGEGETYRSTAACPAGKKALGGGGSQGDFGWYVDDSAPTDNGASWYVEYSPSIAGEPGGGIGEAWAVCGIVDEETPTPSPTDAPAAQAIGAPKTGQTQCWDADGNLIDCAGTGQDGEYQAGIDPVVAPTCCGTTNAYNTPAWTGVRLTDNGDGTVTDNLTGLIWLQDANCFGPERIDWALALDDANTLNSGECGLTDGSGEGDWRLPNVNELHSLIDLTQSNPALPAGHPFTGVQSRQYWTSTTFDVADVAKSSAWLVDLDSGWVNYNAKGGISYVWPVRGGL